MRLRVKLCPERDVEIPLHYGHILQKNIYDTLEPSYARFLHERGYEWGGRRYRLFTFSRLAVHDKEVRERTLVVKPGEAWLTVAALDENFVFAFIEGLIDKRHFTLEGVRVGVESVWVRKEFASEKLVGLTISPVVATKSLPGGYGFYSASDPGFLRALETNLRRKYAAFYRREYGGKLEVGFLDSSRIARVVGFYKKWPYEAYLGGFVIRGSPDIVKVAYSAGIGNKNSQGFGCVERISEVNKLDRYRRVV